MNMNYNSLTSMYESMFTQMYIFLVEKYFLQFWLKEIYGKQQKYRKYVHLGQHTFIHCSRITVDHVNFQHFYLKFTQHATVAQTEPKQEVTKKMTDKPAAECSKAAYLDVN